MADLRDVMNALVAQITTVIYPNGTNASPSNGAPTTIYPGWPVSTVLDADLDAMFAAIQAGNGPTAGRIHVSVFTGNVETNQTRFIDGYQPIAAAVNNSIATAKEVLRVKRQFQVTIFAPTPNLRDMTGSLINTEICSLRNLPLADGSVAQVYYGSTAIDDVPQKETLFRRSMLYYIEYATFENATVPTVQTVIENISGGVDPAQPAIKTITIT